jgi:hypothetical protein
MSKYKMDDGVVVDTDRAQRTWTEARHFDGRNHVAATGGQWAHQRLLKSRKGRYYIEHWSQWQGTTASASWISTREAAAWLITNEHIVPVDLAAEAEEITE